MNKKSIWIGVVIIILIIIGVSVRRDDKPKTATEPIKIGAALSLSGIASADGESIKNGLELARADLKAKGVDVDIIYQDDKTEPKDTVGAINALNAMGVSAIIGPTWSYLADSGVPVGDRLKIVMVMPANTSEYVAARSPYAFFTTARVANLVEPLTAWLKQSGKKRIALVANQGLWYETIEKNVDMAAKNAGIEIVYRESIPFGAASSGLSTIMTKVNASKPDLIFTEVDEDQAVVALFSKLNQLGIKADVMSVTTALGRILASGNIHLNTGSSLYLAAPKASEAFDAKYRAAYGTGAKPYADRAYDSLMLVVDSVQHRGVTPLNEYMSTKTSYNGYLGNYKFDSNGDISEGEWSVSKLK